MTGFTAASVEVTNGQASSLPPSLCCGILHAVFSVTPTCCDSGSCKYALTMFAVLRMPASHGRLVAAKQLSCFKHSSVQEMRERGPACLQVYLLVANPSLPNQQYWVWVLADLGAADVAVTLSPRSSAAAVRSKITRLLNQQTRCILNMLA